MLFGKNKTHNLFLMFHSLHSTLFHRLRLLWAYIENFVFFFTQRAISVPFQQFYRAKIYVETQQKCTHISKFILCKIYTTISEFWESQQCIIVHCTLLTQSESCYCPLILCWSHSWLYFLSCTYFLYYCCKRKKL